MSSKLKLNQIRFEHHTYQYEDGPVDYSTGGPSTPRWWDRLGSRPRELNKSKDTKLVRMLNKLVDEDNRESVGGYTSRQLREEKSKKKQNRKDRAELHQDAHGILWLPDYKPTTSKRAFFFGLRMHGKKNLKGITHYELRTSKGRVTHLLDKKAMTALLRKVVSTYERVHGEKALRKALQKFIYPTSRGTSKLHLPH
jgi:hypothetical protein